MRSLPVAVLAALLLAACAHRYPVNPGGDREAVAGLPLSFGTATEPLPEGTTVKWVFGDGTEATGQVVEHVFARAGEYVVKMEVTDSRGTRVAEAKVAVARRPPAAAVPPGATSAILVDRLFAKMSAHVALAERFLPKEELEEVLGEAGKLFGFDLRDPQAALKAGFDPEEGLAISFLPGDPGVWLAVGIHDEQAALETVKSVFQREAQTTFEPGPAGSLVAEGNNGPVNLFAYRGYLYLRLPTGEGEGAPALEAVQRAPVEGLFADAAFAKARAKVRGEDAFAFVRAEAFPDRERMQEEVEGLEHVTAIAAALTANEKEVALRFLGLLDPAGLKTLGESMASTRRIDLAKKAPAGALAYLAMATAAEKLKANLKGHEGECKVPSDLTDPLGLDCEQFLNLFSGEMGVAVYFDFAGLVEQMLTSESNPASNLQLIAQVGVTDRAKAKEVMKLGAEKVEMTAVPKIADAYEKDVDGVKVGVALSGDAMLLGTGGAYERTLLGVSPDKSLAPSLAKVLPDPSAGHQVLFVDVATIVDGLRGGQGAAGDSSNLGMLGALALHVLEEPESGLRMLLPLKTALAELWMESDGLAGQVVFELR